MNKTVLDQQQSAFESRSPRVAIPGESNEYLERILPEAGAWQSRHLKDRLEGLGPRATASRPCFVGL